MVRRLSFEKDIQSKLPLEKFAPILERTAQVVVAALTLVVLIQQLSSLYIFPMPDSARWWGDETGQIVELKAETQQGYASIPIGKGSTVAITNGILRGNSWLAALVYGVPSRIFSDSCDVVSIGRTVTAILSVGLLVALFFCCRSLEVSVVFSQLAVLILLTTRSFLFASHAARLDIAAGLAILLWVTYALKKISAYQKGEWVPSARWFFFFGAITFSLATLSIHLLTLLPLAAIYLLFTLGAFKKPARLLAAIGGVAMVALILLGIYVLSGAPMTLFGVTAKHTQFHSVISEVPITKLFSRSVQFANLHQRWDGFIHEAPSILLLMGFGLVAAFMSRKQSFVAIAMLACVIVSWLLFQSYAIYYYLHVLPVLVLISFGSIAHILTQKRLVPSLFSIVVAFLVAHFGFYDGVHAKESAIRLTASNRSVLEAAFATIPLEKSPVVLIQNPGLAWLLKRDPFGTMSEHFISFPLDDRPPSEVMKAQRVQYLALYSEPGNPNYADEFAPLKQVADSLGTMVSTKTGLLFDAGRDYFALDTMRIDTLRLYKLPF
jgi:hypothetical protein